MLCGFVVVDVLIVVWCSLRFVGCMWLSCGVRWLLFLVCCLTCDED